MLPLLNTALECCDRDLFSFEKSLSVNDRHFVWRWWSIDFDAYSSIRGAIVLFYFSQSLQRLNLEVYLIEWRKRNIQGTHNRKVSNSICVCISVGALLCYMTMKCCVAVLLFLKYFGRYISLPCYEITKNSTCEIIYRICNICEFIIQQGKLPCHFTVLRYSYPDIYWK